MKELKHFNFSGNQNSSTKEQNYKQAYEKYSKLDENELINQLLLHIEKGKQEGSFSNEQLLNFVNTIAPSLNEEQKERLYNIVRIIRN